MNGLPPSLWKNAVPEEFSLLRTLQLAKMGGAQLPPPTTPLIREVVVRSEERAKSQTF
jgi:hypothetical protein